jgi:hypothetical protein
MAHVMPQVALQRLLQEGVKLVKENPEILDCIFQYYTCDAMDADYGQSYIEEIKTWFVKTKIPVVQAWSYDPQQVPQITVKLATEQEDETKAAMGDFWDYGEEANIGVAPFVVNLDITIRSSANGDQVLWLYYIVNYILFKRKRRAEQLGLQLHTFSATDYSRDNTKLADNIWERYIRFRTVVQNFWDSEDYIDINDLDVDLDAESNIGSGSVDLG